MEEPQAPRRDVMYLRNMIHGAKASDLRLASKLREIDRNLNKTLIPERQIHKDNDYYIKVAKEFNRKMHS